ncbi:MAG: hypothetical protein KAU28_10435, partial [Phycisphaerae bacterium]|nr:hypothetical protein [Phycisphaerae bacterium]
MITADLHYDLRRSRAPARRAAEEICADRGRGPAVLVLIGDIAGADLSILRECLQLFRRFDGLKLLVPGNHCLWCRDGEDSLRRYERTIPAVAAEEGFGVLDHKPAMLDGVGLVGSIGWYDYSFRCESLGIPTDFYRAKVAPGAAKQLGGQYRELLERHRDRLTERHFSMCMRWMDGAHVRLGISDEAFVELLADKL